MGANRRPKTTTTQAISFKNEIYKVLEEQIATAGPGGTAQPRSTYVVESLIKRWEREGVWPPKATKGGRR